MYSIILKNRRFKTRKTNFKESLNKVTPYTFILPITILIVSFYIIPVLLSIYFSFTDYNIIKLPNFIGLDNYYKLLKDTTFKTSIKNTLFFTLGVVPTQSFLALIMAYSLLNKKKSFLASFVKGAMFIPVISSMVLISIVWRILLNGEASPLNMLITFLNFDRPNWLGDPHLVLPILMLITVWKNTGYFMVLYIAGLMDIPTTAIEAATIDGASKKDIFFYIILPLLKPTTLVVVFLGVVWSLQTFDLIYNLTGGGPGNSSMTLVLHIYNNAFKNFNTGYAMTISNILLLTAGSITALQKGLLNRDKSNIY